MKESKPNGKFFLVVNINNSITPSPQREENKDLLGSLSRKFSLKMDFININSLSITQDEKGFASNSKLLQKFLTNIADN